MKVKKTIWIPLVLGIALGLLDYVSIAVHFVLPTSEETFVGPQEVFVLVSAALGGPVGLFITSLFQEVAVHLFLLKGQLPPEQAPLEIFISTADFFAHILAGLAVVYCYRFLHQRAKRAITFSVGWIPIVLIYYALLLSLQSLLYNIVIPGMLPLFVWIRSSLMEVLVAVMISSLVWIALPVRFRRPLWIGRQPATSPAEEKV